MIVNKKIEGCDVINFAANDDVLTVNHCQMDDVCFKIKLLTTRGEALIYFTWCQRWDRTIHTCHLLEVEEWADHPCNSPHNLSSGGVPDSCHASHGPDGPPRNQ